MTTDPKRQQPADEGRNHDPHLRDETAQQPGKNTISSSGYDEENQELTETAKDDFREDIETDTKADPRFDE